MPEIEGYRSRGPSMNTSRSETNLYYQSPKTTLGYGQGLMPSSGGATSELRGRIKRLLCRSKQNPHYFRYRPENVL
ncbi:hypothetical protein Ciccas_008235 [Cichlidogyrus casuarinus]|uniref:Uncharacterized protein n=1 Tax=Cichlidogyrus casuarinus TaxID=1844966 RepID=A0ABD2Q0V9_9PLAT